MSLLRTTLSRTLPLRSSTHLRTLSTSPLLANKGPQLTQGHTTDKATDSGHKDYDVQSASVRAGKNAKEHNDDTAGENQPIDAARQGHSDGKPKAGGGETAGKGSFMDQVGGQEGSGGSKDVKVGGTEETGAGSWTDLAKKMVGGKTEGTRSIHTSAIRFRPEPASDAGPGSRQPKTQVEGDQNPHLKHKSPSASDSGKGNASEDPHLPSKSASKSSSGSATTEPAHGDVGKLRGFHSSARARSVEPSLDSSPASSQPAKDDSVKTDHEQMSKSTTKTSADKGKGDVSDEPHLASTSSDATGAATHGAGTASGVAQGQPTKPLSGQKKGLHTSSRVSSIEPSANSSPASNKGPKDDSVKVDYDQSAKSTTPTSADQGKGNVGDKPHVGSTSTDATSAATHGAGVGEGVSQGLGQAKRPNDPAGQKRGYATRPPGGYSKALETEPIKSGYNAPPEALPSQLDSAYSPEAINRDTENLTPSSQALHSSTATSPPNEALKKAAMNGGEGLGERNDQPDGEIGKLGNKEAWKHRK